MAGENEKDILGMSDEEFLQMGTAPTVEEPVKEESEVEPVTEPVEPVVEENDKEEVETTTQTPEPEVETTEVKDKPVTDTTVVEQDKDKQTPVKDKSVVDEPKVETKEVDYKGFFEKVMAPFQANGKKIELKDPSEAIQLMQMGANYTAKMQQIAPHRKVLMMLQNNGLLDEGKLSYLIDIDKKDPEAIKKLIKDAGIDPMDIDTNVEPAYREGNHRVSDKAATFQSVLDDVIVSDSGKQLVQEITKWDQASKDLLWDSPEAMVHLHQQRDSGMYDLIAAEVNRRKQLGTIPVTAPFIQAYMAVGNEMQANGAFADLVPKPEPVKPAPVATRVVAPKPAVNNDTKANAAAPTRSSPTGAKVIVNPLEMSDDDFLKQFNGRV